MNIARLFRLCSGLPLGAGLALLLWAAPVLSQQNAFTLEQAVKRGLEANPSVESRQKILEQAEFNIGTQRGAFFPTLSGFYTHQNYWHHGIARTGDDVTKEQMYYGLRLTQPVFAGFGILNSYLRSKIQAAVEKERVRQSKLDLTFNIQSEFIKLLRDKRDLKTIHDAIARLEKQLESSEAFYKVGMGPYLSVLRSKVDLEKAKREEINIKNSIKSHQTQLANYLALPVDAKVEYHGNLESFSMVYDKDQVKAIEQALAHRPDVIAGKKNIEIAVKDSYITASQYFPKINVQGEGGDVYTRYEQDRSQSGSTQYASVTINLTWELFNGGSTTYKFMGDKKRVEALKKDFENIVESAKTDIIKCYIAIDDALKLITVCLATIDQAKEAYDMAKKRYETQIGTITDLMDTDFQLTKAEGDYNQAVAEFHLARAKLFYNVGEEHIDLH